MSDCLCAFPASVSDVDIVEAPEPTAAASIPTAAGSAAINETLCLDAIACVQYAACSYSPQSYMDPYMDMCMFVEEMKDCIPDACCSDPSVVDMVEETNAALDMMYISCASRACGKPREPLLKTRSVDGDQLSIIEAKFEIKSFEPPDMGESPGPKMEVAVFTVQFNANLAWTISLPNERDLLASYAPPWGLDQGSLNLLKSWNNTVKSLADFESSIPEKNEYGYRESDLLTRIANDFKLGSLDLKIDCDGPLRGQPGRDGMIMIPPANNPVPVNLFL